MLSYLEGVHYGNKNMAKGDEGRKVLKIMRGVMTVNWDTFKDAAGKVYRSVRTFPGTGGIFDGSKERVSMLTHMYSVGASVVS